MGTFLALASIEIGFRLSGVRPPTAEAFERSYIDAEAVRRYRRELNGLGYHDGEWRIPKPRGTWRVLVLGDSFTEGMQVPRDALFTEVVERSLTERLERRIELVNLAKGGWGTVNELDALERWLEAGADPDAVLLVYFVNDATALESNPVLVEDLHRTLAQRGGALSRVSAAWDWMDWVVRKRRVARVTLRDYRASFEGDERSQHQWRRSRRALAEMAELSREREFRFGVVLFPVLAQLDGDHGLTDLYALVEEHCRGLGVPYRCLLDAFRGRDALSLWISPVNAHPNARGHAIAAGAVEEFLVDAELVPPPRPAPQSSPR